MFSFRQKVFFSFAIVFLLLTLLTFPLVSHIVRSIAAKAMEDRADELITKIQSAPNTDALIRRLKEQQALIFFRVSVINDDQRVIYDSHTKRLLGPRFSQEYVVDHPEVLEALEKGVGYNEDFAELLDQKFSYLAKAFDFHGKTFVIRIAFPYKYFHELARNCEIAFLSLITSTLLLFSAFTWFIFNHFTRPIQQIINAVTPYQEGRQTIIPEINIKTNKDDEFFKLAMTLNSLSARIQKHIENLVLERNQKEAILESLTEGVIAVDRNMTITYANNMALNFLGKNSKDLFNKNFTSAGLPEGYSLLFSCQTEKKALTNTVTVEKDHKNKLYLDIIAVPIGSGEGAVLVMQDKSTHNKLLEMRKDFISNASHELKTPVTIIRGFAETLHDNPELPLETRQDVTKKIVSNCQRMTALIKDLLILSDIENIPLSRLHECDLFELLSKCCHTIQEIYPAAEISLNKTSTDHFITEADPSLLELAFMNLIENAAKYSAPPAHIKIVLDKVDGKIKITISDQGIGIPAADLEHVFDRFYTVDKAHSRKLGGSGLGLSIVQNVIHKHSGQITVESQMGVGTTFTIIFDIPSIS